MNNLDSILKCIDITLPTKVCLVKATVFPVAMYARQQKRHKCIEQSFGLCRRGQGGMIWENGIETCIISYVK